MSNLDVSVKHYIKDKTELYALGMEILCKAAEEYCTQQREGMWLHHNHEVIDNKNI